ncbi:DUF7373 family lipoprotein [Gordonia insulae]|uniref:PknH-like extracellular domain-containing protein n=1 Tax=Gordonia insulae TaxID=2420509 RepID=A0A3G8JPH7_9ACTN|nr:hypothetical protein [Gordonia insulae]AZG46873.1 hypothetical protein D7316_03478 [Gordonia insulae]
MKSWQPAVRWMGIAAAAAVIAGCTTNGEATSVDAAGAAGSSSAADPSVDVAALDTGNYPTSPRPAFGTATQDDILQIEGQRMAQFIVVPFEIDPDLTNTKMPTMVITGQNNLKGVLSDRPATVPANKALVGGFVTTASTQSARDQSSINNMVVRYLTPADAKAAAEQMAAAMVGPGTTRTTLPGLPDTLVLRSDEGGSPKMIAFTAHNNYVLYQWLKTPPEKQAELEPTIRKAIGLQTTLIDQFPATPTKAEAAARGIPGRSLPVIDQNHVLIYALPYTDEEMRDAKKFVPGASVRAVYGPRGIAHMSSDPVTDYSVLTKVGSTANAVERSTVYRAETPEGATSIVDTFLASNRSKGWSDVASPAGLPNAKCQTISRNGVRYFCIVQKGRYVGSVSSDRPDDAHKQISAQYVILTKADQDAH